MNEDRIVLPIPPGKHWSDELPVLMPAPVEKQKQLPVPRKAGEKAMTVPRRAVVGRAMSLRFSNPKPVEEKTPKEKKSKRKHDPKLISAARELRDRWLEHVNAGEMLIEASGKYDVTRVLSAPMARTPLLPAA
jgi:hypothetical protein